MSIRKALKVGIKDVSDKVGGLAKGVAGAVSGNRALREDGQAQLDQAHVEPETAAVEAEEKHREADEGALRHLRKL